MKTRNVISPIRVGYISVWDVQFEIKKGKIGKLTPDQAQDLGWMQSGDPLNKRRTKKYTPDTKLTCVESLRLLFRHFQTHIDDGISVFHNVPTLHFLKFAVHSRKTWGGLGTSHFFTFSTQFYDNGDDEQEYTDDMFQKYWPLMDIVWHHCKGVNRILEQEIPDGGQPKAPYKLHPDFMKLVAGGKIDNEGATVFYAANKKLEPRSVDEWQAHSDQLADAGDVLAEARIAIEDGHPTPPWEQILKDLDRNLRSIGV